MAFAAPAAILSHFLSSAVGLEGFEHHLAVLVPTIEMGACGAGHGLVRGVRGVIVERSWLLEMQEEVGKIDLAAMAQEAVLGGEEKGASTSWNDLYQEYAGHVRNANQVIDLTQAMYRVGDQYGPFAPFYRLYVRLMFGADFLADVHATMAAEMAGAATLESTTLLLQRVVQNKAQQRIDPMLRKMVVLAVGIGASTTGWTVYRLLGKEAHSKEEHD